MIADRQATAYTMTVHQYMTLLHERLGFANLSDISPQGLVAMAELNWVNSCFDIRLYDTDALLGGKQGERLFATEDLAQVRFCWSHDGEHLFITAGYCLWYWHKSKLRSYRQPNEINALFCDRSRIYLQHNDHAKTGLIGDTIELKELPLPGRVLAVDSVGFAILNKDTDPPILRVIDSDMRPLLKLPLEKSWTVDVKLTRNHAFLCKTMPDATQSFKLVFERYSLTGGSVTRFVDTKTFPKLGESLPEWQIIDQDMIVFAQDSGSGSKLYSVTTNHSCQLIVTDDGRIDTFRASPDGKTIAALALNGPKEGIYRHQLRVYSRTGAGEHTWELRSTQAGNFGDLRFAQNGGSLLVLSNIACTPDWSPILVILGKPGTPIRQQPRNKQALQQQPSYCNRQDYVGGIIYLPGVHRFFDVRPELCLYRHLVNQHLQLLADSGFLVIPVHDIYTQAKFFHGKDISPTSSYSESIQKGIYNAIGTALNKGIEHPVLYGASLGTLPILDFICTQEPLPAVLLNPVYTTRIGSLSLWRSFLGYDICSDEFRSMANSLSSRCLVIHGYEDTVAPYLFSAELAMINRALITLHTEWNEGHVFKHRQSWENAFHAMNEWLYATQDVGPKITLESSI
jgi:hypothetical protein